MKKLISLLCAFCFSSVSFAAAPYPIHILAAENFYGDVAKNIGGIYVSVDSVMTSPSSDPHFFNAPDNLEALVNQADIIIENGSGYDAWMDVLYQKSDQHAVLMNAASITHIGSNFNPHIWYSPDMMPAFATALTNQLVSMDPDPTHQATYQQNLQAFLNRAQLYQAQVQKVAAQVSTLPITATEPVADYLAQALGLRVRNKEFQYLMMSGAEIPAGILTQFQTSLNTHEVNLLLYNVQVSDPMTEQLKQLAMQNHIPVLGVNEMMPAGTNYYSWMYQELFGIRDALMHNGSSS